MNAWEEPVEVRIASAQAHLLQRLLEAQKRAGSRPEQAVREPAQ